MSLFLSILLSFEDFDPCDDFVNVNFLEVAQSKSDEEPLDFSDELFDKSEGNNLYFYR